MSQVATRFQLTPRQLSLVKSTVAKDCNNDEFSLFMEVSRAKGLDPFLGQIIPMVFNKDKADKRKMTIIISRDGQRVIAQRCGDYRPASKAPVYEIEKDLISTLNPQGILSATTYLWKQDPKSGEWFEVVGQAFWEEMAPISDEWVYDQDAGKRKPSGKKTLDSSGNWCRMPRLMIAKCAEMQALRAGWPEQFTGLFDEAEMDRAKVLDLTATEIVEQEHQENRLRAVGGNNAVTIWWQDGFALENVPDGQLVDRVAEFIRDIPSDQVARWRDANRASLQIFWARRSGDALEMKKLLEAKINQRAGKIDDLTRNHVLAAG